MIIYGLELMFIILTTIVVHLYLVIRTALLVKQKLFNYKSILLLILVESSILLMYVTLYNYGKICIVLPWLILIMTVYKDYKKYWK